MEDIPIHQNQTVFRYKEVLTFDQEEEYKKMMGTENWRRQLEEQRIEKERLAAIRKAKKGKK
jgi:hypothetical protein